MQIQVNVLYIQLSTCRLLIIKLTVCNNISNQAVEILLYIMPHERTVWIWVYLGVYLMMCITDTYKLCI